MSVFFIERADIFTKLLKLILWLKVSFTTTCYEKNRSWGSTVSIGTGYQLDDRGRVRVPVGPRIFSSRRPDQLWGPPNLLSNGYRQLLPGGKAAEA
jgi:hypothetical protein